ncbi:MAG: tRNA lysidine(34) synthetase TilS [Pseudomonadota bacterium]
MKGQTDPLTPEAFKDQCAALSIAPPFTIAVSGGRDSMGLALLAAKAFPDDRHKITALTVDHGLRPDAADEARRVAQWCKALGLRHETLLWDGHKPQTGLQEAARNARYRLIVEATIAAGAKVTLTAHSADDQAETVFMRLRRGAGVAGLAAMRERTKIAAGPSDAITLARPLLEATRAQLTALCHQYDQDFVNDPSNDDPTYERVRVRALMAALEEQDLLTGDALRRTAAHLSRAEDATRAAEEQLFLDLQGCFYASGCASVDGFASTAGAGGLYRRLIFAVSGAQYAPGADEALLAVKTAWEKGAAAVNGALIRRWRDEIWFMREPAALLGRAGVSPMTEAAFPPNGRLLWDNRFIIEIEHTRADLAAKLMVRPFGAEKSLPSHDTAARRGQPAEIAWTAPAIYDENQLLAAPLPLAPDHPSIRLRALAEERFSGAIIRF